jgi:hypothetical protein
MATMTEEDFLTALETGSTYPQSRIWKALSDHNFPYSVYFRTFDDGSAAMLCDEVDTEVYFKDGFIEITCRHTTDHKMQIVDREDMDTAINNIVTTMWLAE